jgi:hypothetical protein
LRLSSTRRAVFLKLISGVLEVMACNFVQENGSLAAVAADVFPIRKLFVFSFAIIRHQVGQRKSIES